MPHLPRLTRAVLGAACVAVLALTTASCGDDPAPSADEALAQRAAAGLEQAYTATYELTGASADAPATTAAAPTATAGTPASATSTVTVHRTADALRLDVKTATGTATSITTSAGTVACQLPGTRAATCLTVAAAGEQPPAAFDPSLRKVFSGSLRTFAESAGRFAVVESAPPTVTFAGETGACFDVPTTGSITSAPGPSPTATAVPVATGTYCLSEDGVPVQVTFDSGTATLTELDRTAPAAATFTPPVKPVPLPTT